MGSRQLRIEPLEDRRLLSVDHILSVDPLPIVVGDTWRYFEGTEQPPAEWNQVAFDDSSWLSGPTGIGFSDDDDATVLDDMPDNYTSVYARRLFHVDDPAAVVSLILAMDYDDGFVAYLNGVEVARSNMAPGATNFDDTATGNHEATGTPERFDISAAADLLLPGVNVLAVQGHNVSLVSHDFSLIPSLFSPVTIYVDDNAPGDPGHGDPTVSDPLENGSQDHPFDAIAEAILAAHDGDTVVLLDGLYMGEGNRDLDFGGRAMIVRSENGPDDCIIDAQGTPADPHRGFVFHRGEGGDSVLQGVTITGGFACLGGGVATFQSSPTLIGCVLLFNSACYDGSGGGMNNQGGNPVVLNCTFLGNVAPEAAEGGGMANWSSSPRVIGCTFMDNMTDWGGGGGMFNDASSHPVVTDSTFLTNRSFGGYSSGKGGAVRNAGGNPSFVGCTFTDNSAEYGGAMDNKEGAPTITECAFTGNSARTGGAVRNTQSEAIITGCTFQGNHASGSGGALHNDTGSAPTLTNCSFLGNWVFADEGSNGGAVSNNRSHLTMVNCLMSGNWADVQIPDHGGGNGGALQNTEGDAALINCTLSGNGGLNAGGIHNDYRSTLELLNSIVFGNHDRDGTGESSQIGRRYDTSVAVDYSCIQGWTGDLGGAGNTGADPQFVDPDGADDTAGTDDDDLRLAAGSPCLDGGDEDAVPPGVTTDLDGNPRFVGMAVDMGAYEFPVPATGVIRGTKFHDLDGDGLQGPNEPGLEGWTIFLDGNENWQWDEGERTTVSDADGNYVFERLVPGRYQVGEVSQEGWQQTFPNPGPSEIRRINVTDDGMQADQDSQRVEISGDGRYVAFESYAHNLVPPDTNSGDVFLYDQQTETIERISLAPDGSEPNARSLDPAISADGRYVLFVSFAGNLYPNDVSGADFFVYDRQTDTLELIPGATQDTCVTSGTSINADGRFVALATDALQLVPGDTNDSRDIFVYDRQTQAFDRVSVASDGSQGDSSSFNPSISADGRFVVFSSYASNLVPDDTNKHEDVFVHDRQTGTTELVSVAPDDTQIGGDCGVISANGRYVAFRSNGVFVHDRATGTTECISSGHSGFPSLSADGRYVAFSSDASNLVSGDTNRETDVFVYDRQTGTMRLVSTGYSGSQGDGESWRPSISADGQYVAFESEATTLVPGDTNGRNDIFVRPATEVGLFGMHVVSVSQGDTVENVDFGNRRLTAGLDHFRWDAISSPQAVGEPFEVTLSARDDVGQPVVDFTDSVNLSALTYDESVFVDGGTLTSEWPMATSRLQSRMQVVYARERLPEASTITGLRLDVSSPPGETMHDWTIRMQHVSSSFVSSWETTGWTTVYQGDLTVTTVGSVEFEFLAPFHYDGMSHLMVDFSFNNSQASYDGVCLIDYPSSPRAIVGSAAGQYGDPLDWSSTNGPIPETVEFAPNLYLTLGREVPLSPSVTGEFANGVWSGRVTILEDAPHVWLCADDGEGHVALSNPFDVLVMTGEIRGTKFHDLDGDGLQGPSEPGLEGWTIFLDANENRQWDEGERTTVSDADGNYVFERLVPGRYQVGEVSQEGWQQTFPNPGPSEIRRINVTDDGMQADQDSQRVEISGDGRYVAFESYAHNLVPPDTNNGDVFLYDRQTETIERISLAPDGSEPNARSLDPAISADGRYVLFVSFAGNLYPNDVSGADFFVYDRQTDTLELIPGATQDTCVTSGTSINADGRYVAFATDAPQLVPGDTNGARDIFVYDRQTQAFERVSVASDGSQGDSSSFNPSISADGRFVVFSSYASNLVANDSNNREDVFVHDRQTGTTELVSVLANGSQFSRSSDCGTISADGRYVAFRANGVYVHDRTTGTTECVSMAYDGSAANDHSGSISLSADGRYVVFSSEASNLVPGDTNGEEDVFVYDRQTGTMRLVSTGYSGLQGNGESWRPVISADGQFVAFESEASTLVPGDTNGFDDIFVRPTAEVGRFGMHVVGVGDGDTVEGVDFGNRQIATSQIDVMLVPVVAPSAAGADALPEALEVVPAGQPYYVELWVQDTGLPAAGVTAGTVDLHYATALADATGVVHLDFDLLPSGQIDDAGGLIDDLGGGTMSVGAGVAPAWTRMAYVEFFATGTGQVAFELSPGSLQFSRAGAGNVAWDFVSLDSRAMVSQIGAAPRVDAALVRQPTSFDQAETGEVAILPSSEAWIHEWEPFWIELWVSTPEMALLGVSGGTVDLSYATEYATAVAIQYGPAFTQNRSGTIADPAGLVDNVGAVTPRTDVGDDQFALLARIRFEPTAEDQAPMQEATHFMGPYDLGLELNEPHLELVGVGPVPAELGTEPSTDLYAVPYDIDDNDQVDFGDLSYFTPAFGRPVGQIEPPYTWWADFDHSGLVDFGDFSDFAANFRRGKPDAEVTMPTGYPDNWHAQQTPTPAEVVGRHVFYNNSVFDGDDPAANAADDAAVAPDKAALMPDQTATFANYTSYVRGINGVMIDVVGLPDEATLDADDFEFRVGNGDAPSGWADAPAPVEISIRAGAGIDGSDRVTIVWPDCAVAKQWLQVTVLPTLNTKLTRPDVFYFGNAVGEAGNATADAKVNAVDVLLARNNPRTFLDPASADFPYDFNRDARVNATDMLIARQSPTHMFNALRLISAPSLEADPAAIVAYFARVLGGKTTESGADKAWALPDRSSACDAVLAVASPQDDGGGAKASAPWDWLYEFEYAGGNHRPAQQRDLADSATVALAMHDGT